MKILISRTDSIGDVILTLPLCGWIKQNIPAAEVHFLCQNLTKSIVERSSHVDHIHIWQGTIPKVDTIIHVFPNKQIAIEAKKIRIKERIGTSHRLFHLTTCNRLVNFSRLRSELHESQLNFCLLKGLGLDVFPDLKEMYDFIGWKLFESSSLTHLDPTKKNIVFHIKSRGSAKEWNASNYLDLARQLESDAYRIIITGTEKEGNLIRKEIPELLLLPNLVDTTGCLSLTELIDLIGASDGLLACSTGPLHIAGVSGTNCLGLYPKKKPMHADRWAPIGPNATYLEESSLSEGKYLNINVEQVLKKILTW